MAGSEPADAIRAVNALLTRLDQLKAAPNVMVGSSGCRRCAMKDGAALCRPASLHKLESCLCHAWRLQRTHPTACFGRSPSRQVLTTSNITEAIDLAFVDRADIKAYIGNPNEQARCGNVACMEAAPQLLHPKSGRLDGPAILHALIRRLQLTLSLHRSGTNLSTYLLWLISLQV